MLDEDKSGSLDPEEILDGLKNYLDIYLSREDTKNLHSYIDQDKNGLIDYLEFEQKINTENIFLKCEPFKIQLGKFIEKLLSEWSFYRDREKMELISIIKKYHTREDFTMDL